MRILFIRQTTTFFSPALGNGVGIIATIASRAGYQVKVIDNNSQYKFYTDNDLLKIVESYKPDLIGFSITMLNAYFTYTVLKKLKARFPNVFFLGGGIHMRHSYEEALNKGFDIVINHEGEAIILPLIEYLEKRNKENFKVGLNAISGISFIDEGGQLRNATEFPVVPNLDELPFVDYNLFNLSDYFKTRREPGVISICGQRGCPFRCTFCTDKFIQKDKRIASADYMFRYVEYLYRAFRRNFIIINDNNFTHPKERAIEFCNNVIESELHGKVKFSVQTKVETAQEEDLIKLMSDAGIVSFGLGIERMEPYSKKMIHKNTPNQKIFKTLELLKKYNMTISVNGILGFPFETQEILKKEREAFLQFSQYTRNINFAVLQPVPGTIYYDYPKAKEWYLDKNIFPLWRSYFATVLEVSKLIQIDQNYFSLDKNILNMIRNIFSEFKYRQHAYYLPEDNLSRISIKLDKLAAFMSKAVFKISPTLEFHIFRRIKSARYFLGSLLFGDKVFAD